MNFTRGCNLKYFVFWIFVSLSAVLHGVPVATVNPVVFKEGSYWTWSYSESQTDSKWKKPYLYETYKVIKREKSKITIAMFSSDSPLFNGQAHHKFEFDIIRCLDLGQNHSTLKRWRVKFYRKDFENSKWEVVSESHKNLVFTEKFNCITNISSKELMVKNIYWLGDWEIFSHLGHNRKSWYFDNHPELKGVTHHKILDSYKMELYDYQMAH